MTSPMNARSASVLRRTFPRAVRPQRSLRVLTLPEAAVELRCSTAQLHNILGGRFPDVPPLPVFHIGRKALIRQRQLSAWIRTLEARERGARYLTGFHGLRDDELEFIAGA